MAWIKKFFSIGEDRGIQFDITVTCIFLVVVTASVLSLRTSRIFEKELVNHKLAEIDSETYMQGLRFQTLIRGAQQDVRFLAGTPPVEGLLRARKEDPEKVKVWTERLTTILLQLGRSKPDYLQIRFIGVEDGGREIVRVDRERIGGELRVVPNEELQQKGSSDYFKDTLSKSPGTVSLSEIELNRENGEISVPHTPVLRASIPVYFEGKPAGMIVINQCVLSIFRDLSLVADHERTYMLTNASGDYLLHPEHDKIFAFEFGTVAKAQLDFPELGQHFEGGREFHTTFTEEHGDGPSLVSARLINYVPNDPTRKLGLVVVEERSEVLGVAKKAERQSLGLVAFLVGLGIIVGTYRAKKISAPFIRMAQELKFFDGSGVPDFPLQARGEVGQLAQAFDSLFVRLKEQRHALEQEVQERERAEREIRAVVNAASDAIITVDARGKIMSFNPRAEKLMGYTSGEAVGRDIQLILPDYLAAHHDLFLDAYGPDWSMNSPEQVTEAHVKRKDGSRFPAEITVGRVRQGRESHSVGIFRDVSRRKQAEEELRQANESLARSNSELEQFAQAASHDLQAPLRAVMSYASLLQMEQGRHLSEQGREFLSKLTESTTRMQNMIKDLLAFSRVNSKHRDYEMVDLNQVVDEAVDNLGFYLRENDARVQYRKLPEIQGYRYLLIQLFQNLIHNAIQYNVEYRVPEINISARREEQNWVISVEDNGRGIKPEFQPTIFRMFDRGEEGIDERKGGRKEGSGIGLSICKKIVQRHGGSISVKSTPGVGSTFLINLPDMPQVPSIDQAGIASSFAK